MEKKTEQDAMRQALFTIVGLGLNWSIPNDFQLFETIMAAHGYMIRDLLDFKNDKISLENNLGRCSGHHPTQIF